jgi:ribonuclease VapC
MVIDSSAIVAIVFRERESQRLAEAIAAAPEKLMSVVNWLEVMMVVESRLGREAANEARLILEELQVRPFPADVKQLHEAVDAWRRYGKGRHPAGLNMGDCCAYAAAVVLGQELLFKGADFGLTDIAQASW